MIRIHIDDSDIRDGLRRLKERSSNLRPVMTQIAGDMADAVEQNFESEGRPKWKPLHPSTIKQRQKKGKWPGKILQVTGRLAASVSQKSTANRAIVGTNVAYAGKMQQDRPFLNLAPPDLIQIQNTIRKHLTQE